MARWTCGTSKGLLLGLLLLYITQSVLGHAVNTDPLPKDCPVINDTYVDCSHCSLKTVPSGIPVTVETLMLSHNTIHLITSDSFKGLVNLTRLYLNHNSISHLESDFFRNQGGLKYLALHHNQLSKLPEDVFVNTPDIEFLDLSYMNQGFTNLPKALRGLTQLRYLNLSSNRINSADFPSDVQLPFLQVLDLGKNGIQSLVTGDFLALTNASLLCLNLTANAISDIDADVFDPLKSLDEIDVSKGLSPPAIPSLAIALFGTHVQRIYLRQIGIQSWMGNNFIGFQDSPLQKLDLSFNELSVLDTQFSGLSNLMNLVIQKNKIANISQTAFSGLKSIEVLDLSGNVLTVVRSGMFDSLSATQLRTLYLNENKIRKLEAPNAFTGLGNLRYLKLSNNKISQKLKSDVFGGLDSLEVLDLGLNNLSLSSNAFDNLTNLQTLYLNLASIKEISVTPSPFNGLKSLTKLDLSNNNMAAVEVDTFASLQNLNILYLQHNNLYNMWNELAHVPFLQKLSKLQEVNLCFNGFQNIPNNTFQGLHRLESLFLCSNKIFHFQDGVFDGLHLRALNLAHNQINLINRTLLEPLLPSLKTLQISDNPFSCSCDLRWFRDWLDVTSVTISDLDRSLCYSPPEMRGTHLTRFHPDTLNCDHELPLYTWILIGVGSASVVVIASLVVRFRWYITYYYYLIRAKRKQYVVLEGEDRQFKYDAFVSFSHKDQEWIDGELLPNIDREHGAEFRLCIHDRDFLLGRKIMDSIVEAIDSSRFTVCVLSDNYLDSPWCKQEREFAMANLIHRDVLIIILLGDIPKKKLTQYYRLHKVMKKRTYLQWPVDDGVIQRGVFWQKLRDVLRDPDMRVNGNVDI